MTDIDELSGFMSLRVTHKEPLANDIWCFELEHPDGEALPPFEPGAHITVVTPIGARRRFSLCGDTTQRRSYQLGIKAERSGRGASVSMVDQIEPGDFLQISAPENSFPLVDAKDYLFIAGGIGITPVLSMMRYLNHIGHTSFQLIYCTRNPELTAFREVLLSPEFSDHVVLHYDNGEPEKVFDFWPLFEKPSKQHVYCCGPRPLMDEIRDMSGHWPSSHIHFEDFASDVTPIREDDQPFKVIHADTGEVIDIPADATILDTLRARGYSLPSSCESGTCGSCRTELVSGEADHRDMVLEDDQKNKPS